MTSDILSLSPRNVGIQVREVKKGFDMQKFIVYYPVNLASQIET